jgi:hypothetical protein
MDPGDEGSKLLQNESAYVSHYMQEYQRTRITSMFNFFENVILICCCNSEIFCATEVELGTLRGFIWLGTGTVGGLF